MEEINEQAEKFSNFLDFADGKYFTMDQLMETGFFESPEEVQVFFKTWNGYYVTKETCESLLNEKYFIGIE